MAELIKGRRKIKIYKAVYNLLKIFRLADLEKVRNIYLKNLKGKILDIGVGDAGNYKYYRKNAKINVLDFEKNMLEQAREKIAKDKLKNYKFVYGNAQDLPFKDNEFNAVVVFFIYCCSVPLAIEALKEAKMVLKRNGRLVVVAHVASKNKLIYFLQKMMEPFSKKFIGSDMTRETEKDIIKAGFKIIDKKVLGGKDIFNVFIAEK